MAVKVLSLGSAGSAAAGITVTGATNATPIVITLGAGHGLKEGDRIAISGVTGNTNANGEWSLISVGATTATLAGSAGNGTFGGTVRVGVLCDKTPHMQNHSGALNVGGNLVGTVDIEAYANYTDFAAGANNFGAVAPVPSPSFGTNSAGSTSTPAKTTLTAAATNAAFVTEIKMPRILRMVVTAYTSGTGAAFIEA